MIQTFLLVFGIIFTVFSLSFIMLNIRYIFKKEEFRGTCSSNNPLLKNEIGSCKLCGKTADEACKMPEITPKTDNQ